MKRLGVFSLVLLGLVAVGMIFLPAPSPATPDRPRIIIPILPRNDPPRLPRQPRCPRDSPCPGVSLNVPFGAAVGGRVCADGTQLAADYPASRHMENCGGSDGKGLCVYTSASMAMDWQGVREGRQLRDFMRHRPGGGTPTKFARDMEEYWRSQNKPVPAYIQYEGRDLAPIIKACSSGRLVCGTYYRSPTGRYGGQVVYHMVNYVLADGTHFAVLDNNHIGDRSFEHMGRAEFERCVFDQQGRVWAIVFLAPPPPPPPHNSDKGSV